ncbi:hypothetical protein LTR96_007863 [Exophiala xenobiotica]|nr:hypothetical protein LTR96_007863 [Exophiala xenobiotica]KAK5334643.1 hypothetical protein LTR98_009016 [Exophiala xenobiotica]
MLSEVGQRWPGIETGQILLVGCSGGGQFALKFFYLHPDRLMAVSIGAPGVVTRLDDTLEWPRGTKDTETLVGEAARVADLDALRGVQGVQLVVGSLDVQDVINPGFYSWMLSKQDSASEPDRGSRADNAAAILSLPTRKAALEGLHEDLKARGICSELQIVDSVAHDAAGVLEQVTSFLARFLQR